MHLWAARSFWRQRRKSDSTSIGEASGMYQVGKIDHDVLEGHRTGLCCPTVGSCRYGHTRTPCAAWRGPWSLKPGSAAIPAIYNDRIRAALLSGEAAVQYVVLNGITSRDIRLGMASTSHHGSYGSRRLHQLRHPHPRHLPMGIGLDSKTVIGWLEEYGTTSRLSARINPASREFDAGDFYKASGIPEVQRQMKPLLYNDCMTVTGKSIGENAAAYQSLPEEPRSSPPWRSHSPPWQDSPSCTATSLLTPL